VASSAPTTQGCAPHDATLPRASQCTVLAGPAQNSLQYTLHDATPSSGQNTLGSSSRDATLPRAPKDTLQDPAPTATKGPMPGIPGDTHMCIWVPWFYLLPVLRLSCLAIFSPASQEAWLLRAHDIFPHLTWLPLTELDNWAIEAHPLIIVHLPESTLTVIPASWWPRFSILWFNVDGGSTPPPQLPFSIPSSKATLETYH